MLRTQPEDELAAYVITPDADVITPDADVANDNERASPAQQAIYVRARKNQNDLASFVIVCHPAAKVTLIDLSMTPIS